VRSPVGSGKRAFYGGLQPLLRTPINTESSVLTSILRMEELDH